jgi:predicted transcriptional regulator
MPNRVKRSISLPPELSAKIDQAARAGGTTPSAWLAHAAAHQLKVEAGLAGIAEWEKLTGRPLTPEEIESGREWAEDIDRRVHALKASNRKTA